MVICQWLSIDKSFIKFLLLILLDGKKGRNRDALGKNTSSKAGFLILRLHNSSEDIFLLLPLHLLIVLSSFCLLAAKLGVSIFGKDNVGKKKGDNLGSISADADRRTRVDNLDIKTDANTVTDNSGIAADNLSIVANNPGIATDNSGIVADDLGIAANNPDTRTNADIGVNNLGIAASNINSCRIPLYFTLYLFFAWFFL